MKFQLQLAKTPTKSTPDWSEFHGDPNFIVERKWDGMRAVFELDAIAGTTKIFSRTGQDLLPQFPELADLHDRIPVNCILDGEIVAYKDAGWECLELLQYRISDKKARRVDEIPVDVKFFDILELFGRPCMNNTLAERRAFLCRILNEFGWDEPEVLEGATIPSYWEGVVVKDLSSKYLPGKRTREWLKFKTVQRATLWAYDLTQGLGARASSFGAILVRDQNGVHRGQVGSGFTPEQIAEVMDRHLLGDEYLIEVEYRFLSKTGLMVNTAFKGFRTDKDVADCL